MEKLSKKNIYLQLPIDEGIYRGYVTPFIVGAHLVYVELEYFESFVLNKEMGQKATGNLCVFHHGNLCADNIFMAGQPTHPQSEVYTRPEIKPYDQGSLTSGFP